MPIDVKYICQIMRYIWHRFDMIFISHDLSVVKYISDQIMVMNHGDIVEQGTHKELLAKFGFYYELYMSQFKKQEEVAEAGMVAK